MSADDALAAAPDRSHLAKDSSATEPKPSYRSWKKKFKKMKHVFDQRMRESDQLFREEQQAHDTSRRLAEENDQLLDLLLDVNSSTHIPPKHRVSLSSPPASPVALTNGLTPHPKSFADLLATVPHTNQLPSPPSPSLPPTYLTPAQEDDYLYALDESILHSPRPPSKSRSSKSHPPTIEDTERESAAHHDLVLRNPVSVYNWLRRHQPQVFLQDNEGIQEKLGLKSSRGAGKRGSVAKREAAAAAAASHGHAHAHDDLDGSEDLYGALPPPAGNEEGKKGKRKREEDEGYRPRGGGRESTGKAASKRKRESDVSLGASGKKAKRISAGGRAGGSHDY